MVSRIPLLAGFVTMKFISTIFPVVALLVGNQLGFAQGFVNLDFEAATIAPIPGGSIYPADPAQCFPGWTIGYGVVMYNDLSLGAPATVLMGPDFPNAVNYVPLQGSYSVLLQFFYLDGNWSGYMPSLSQTGLVPANAQSVSLLVSSGTPPGAAVVTMNGVNIPLISVAGGRLAGDISAYAGSVAQLKISTPNSDDWLYFDDVQFSTSSIPEPSKLALTALGALLLGFRRLLRHG
jgi:hypothetical protein